MDKKIAHMEHKRRLLIENDLGLHGRAAAKIVDLNGRYKSRLFLKKDGHEEVDGTNILSILSLACTKGTEIEARAVGIDSKELLDSLSGLFNRKFGEEK